MRVKLEDIRTFVQARLSKKRFNHVLGVIETAKDLARRHGVEELDAEVAALIHDVAKEQSLTQTAGLLRVAGEGAYLEHSDKVWHAPMGAIIAEKSLAIENKDILNAIKYHTTGRAAMSELEKVIFIADYTEPNRTFDGAIAVREFWDDLDKAVYEILKQKVEKVTSLGLPMHPDTTAAHDYYHELFSGERNSN